jgi:CAAX prenyl protease-like protein
MNPNATARAVRESEIEPEQSTLSQAVPYVVPFLAFFLVLGASPYLRFLGEWEYPLGCVFLAAVLYAFSRRVIDFRVRMPIRSIILGVAVCVIWVAPDLLFAGWRSHWLFENPLTGKVTVSMPEALRSNATAIFFRSVRAVILVSIIEELFWRAWLMRWLINTDIQKVALGAYSASSIIITALLFGSEHGPFWEVGIIAGLLYNWWMVKTKNLGDCILAHAVTNACLCGYVIATGSWQYWM